MIDAENIDLSPLTRIAQEVYRLAKKIDETYCDPKAVSLKGIGIDGCLVAQGLRHVFENEYRIRLYVEPVEISSHEGKISFDTERMDAFKVKLEESEYEKVILLVDKKSDTGSLGSWMKKRVSRI